MGYEPVRTYDRFGRPHTPPGLCYEQSGQELWWALGWYDVYKHNIMTVGRIQLWQKSLFVFCSVPPHNRHCDGWDPFVPRPNNSFCWLVKPVRT
jgi:hypothetical protein